VASAGATPAAPRKPRWRAPWSTSPCSSCTTATPRTKRRGHTSGPFPDARKNRLNGRKSLQETEGRPPTIPHGQGDCGCAVKHGCKELCLRCQAAPSPRNHRARPIDLEDRGTQLQPPTIPGPRGHPLRSLRGPVIAGPPNDSGWLARWGEANRSSRAVSGKPPQRHSSCAVNFWRLAGRLTASTRQSMSRGGAPARSSPLQDAERWASELGKS
jgi:hypothetical protein